MRHEETSRNHAREIRELEVEQRRAALAEKLLKSKKLEDPFWKMPPHAPLVQRIGVCIVGFFFLLIGGIIWWSGFEDRNWFAIVISSCFVLVGGYSVRNAFQRSQRNGRRQAGSPGASVKK